MSQHDIKHRLSRVLFKLVHHKINNMVSTAQKVSVDKAMIPKKFFVTGGKAISPASELNALDRALKNAGIAQCNLVSVTSILPPGCKQVANMRIPVGSITHAVMAKMDGGEGTIVAAGIAWTWEKDGKYGLVAEAHGYVDRRALQKTLDLEISEMATTRGIEIEKINHRIEVLRVPKGNYGCVIAALVYVT